jgi:dolichol-phosphate mannosyltransferase
MDQESLPGLRSLEAVDHWNGQAALLPTGARVWLLLPAYNEEQSLPLLLRRAKSTFENNHLAYQVLVCDDGSRDRTSSILKEFGKIMPVEAFSHSMNRGLGETVRDLFEHAAQACAQNDVLIRMDCDDTHDPASIPALVAKLNEGFDVVIASRFQEGGGQVGVGRLRSSYSKLANLFMRCVFHVPKVREYSCGYRAYRAAIVQKALHIFGNDFIQLKGLGFTCTLEKLVKFHLLGARFAEIPFVLRYDQKKGRSKMIANITTLGYFTMAICYHWPWNGWKSYYKNAIPDELVTLGSAFEGDSAPDLNVAA